MQQAKHTPAFGEILTARVLRQVGKTPFFDVGFRPEASFYMEDTFIFRSYSSRAYALWKPCMMSDSVSTGVKRAVPA